MLTWSWDLYKKGMGRRAHLEIARHISILLLWRVSRVSGSSMGIQWQGQESHSPCLQHAFHLMTETVWCSNVCYAWWSCEIITCFFKRSLIAKCSATNKYDIFNKKNKKNCRTVEDGYHRKLHGINSGQGKVWKDFMEEISFKPILKSWYTTLRQQRILFWGAILFIPQ